MVGRAIDELYPRGCARRGKALLEVEGLVPGSATFTLAPGRDPRNRRAGRRWPHAAVAHALRARACPFRPRFGSACTPGRRRPRRDGARAWGFVSEDRAGEGLAAGLSVAANLTASRLDGLGPGFVVLPSREDEAARRWIDRLGIRCTSPRQPIAALSGGNQQKVAVARLLHHDVDVLVLDEPTRGIDVASKAQIYALIDQLVAPPSGAASGAAEGRAAREQLSARARRRLRSHRGDVARTAGRAAAGRRMDGARAAHGGVRRRSRPHERAPAARRARRAHRPAPRVGAVCRARRPAVSARRQPRADGAPGRDRVGRRARNDDGDCRGRDRPVRRIDRRAQHGRHRTAAALDESDGRGARRGRR